ncbi:MAG: hypothetical protein JXQ84_07735 [Rhodospirillaceae bacterium]|nr:hypothetical protein [Rhodospirillaceae bacterium]
MTNPYDRPALAAEKIGTVRASLMRSYDVWSHLGDNGKTVHLPPAQTARIAQYFADVIGVLDAAATLLGIPLVPLPPAPQPNPSAQAANSGPRLVTRNGEPL